MRVMLADPAALVRSALRSWISTHAQPAIEVLADVPDLETLVSRAAQQRPDLLIVEYAIGALAGGELVQSLKRQLPGVSIMLLTAECQTLAIRDCMQAGAAAYVLKDAEPAELTTALQAIEQGQCYVSSRVAASVAERRTAARGTREGALTPRQRQVLRRMARGQSTREIAAGMGVSIKTVETHRARMADVLGLQGIHALMHFAIKLGMDRDEK